jgi:hypothetical protein
MRLAATALLGLSLSIAALSSTATASAAPSPSLSIKRLVLAHGVEGREPQSETTSFDMKDDRVYAFMEVENTTKSEKTISVVFEPPSGAAFGAIPLKVGEGPRFRTWAFTRRAHEKGEWAVVVRSGDTVLGRQTFTVK